MADRYWRAAEGMCRNHPAYAMVLTKFKQDDEKTIHWFTHYQDGLGFDTPAQLLLNSKTDELYHFLGTFL